MAMPGKQKRLILIDANALIHRSFHAVPPLTTGDGQLVNAVFGFTSTILKVFAEFTPEYVAVCFDRGKPKFRLAAFAQYKAKRPQLDQGLAPQFELVGQVVDAFNIPQFAIESYEADDLIATLARQAEQSRGVKEQESKRAKSTPALQLSSSPALVDEVIIVTGDKDMLQLVSDRVKVYMPRRSISDTMLYDEAAVTKRFGLSPKQLIDYKALAGDPSDNIPGVLGVGEKTATDLIGKFGNIENLYKNLDQVPEKIRQKLVKDRQVAFLSKKLVQLVDDAPIKLNLAKCRLHDYDKIKVYSLFEKLRFKSLLSRLPKSLATHHLTPTTQAVSSQQLAVSLQTDLFDGKKAFDSQNLDEALQPILENMGRAGILVDVEVLAKLQKEMISKLNQLEKQIYQEVGHEFNINSTKQLAPILFDELRLPVVRKIKTGRSTDESVLKSLAHLHPVVRLLLDYRELFKLKTTYIDALPKVQGEDGRIHTTFRLDVASTGRLTSQNPNLQNVPVRGDWGAKIRSAFIAPPKFMLVSFDYSQIELRILAHIAQDPGLIEAFAQGKDIHAVTAARVLDKSLEQVTTEDRRMAKTVNFGLMYGMSVYGLSQTLGIEHGRAARFIEDYFAEFPRVRSYMDETISQARQTGYVQTLLGRKRFIPELAVTKATIRSAGERMAINMPIQGTAADIIKKAMVDLWSVVGSQWSEVKLVLQIHDELLFEIREGEVDRWVPIIKDKMEHALKLSVPIVVDVKVGKNWGEMQRLMMKDEG